MKITSPLSTWGFDRSTDNDTFEILSVDLVSHWLQVYSEKIGGCIEVYR